jgi:hypothetical protein
LIDNRMSRPSRPYRTNRILPKFGHEGNRNSEPPIFTGTLQLAGTAWGQKMAMALPISRSRST